MDANIDGDKDYSDAENIKVFNFIKILFDH